MLTPLFYGMEDRDLVFFDPKFKRVNIFYNHSYPYYNDKSDMKIVTSTLKLIDFIHLLWLGNILPIK